MPSARHELQLAVTDDGFVLSMSPPTICCTSEL
eukprot:CAMPEP_0197700396 /NCGR_PEP_ID=MMETSP1338-20131121/121929_1 /TAXON_ID=43686 ORGANISM="Pelagodinium beii, Strain RCC1491" /NCGR_SAMPLE_ID=MMETSP1338 /ASSEMBLY_ACC=CAM_ASM_000754 /LENGTH=32 /DNA_ID= /DNA_START= /DNA_END= /DNA_ORIENTATION=